mgnify:CR=1 FL=1
MVVLRDFYRKFYLPFKTQKENFPLPSKNKPSLKNTKKHHETHPQGRKQQPIGPMGRTKHNQAQ